MTVLMLPDLGTISPLQVGQWLPQPAPEPLARTYAPHTITASVKASVAQAKVRKRSLVIGRGRSRKGARAPLP
jgi:hypothetical protein